MSTPAAARAEKSLRERHLRAWPRKLYCCDHDAIRVATGRKLLLEVPRGKLAAAVEYKAVDEGDLELSSLQFEVMADASDSKPALCVQFTHPELSPPQPWSFRLWPLNALAEPIAPRTLTEQQYVQLLYILSWGPLSGGGRGDPGYLTWESPWRELSHLDSRLPDVSRWPPVKLATPRPFGEPSLLYLSAAHQFVEEKGQPVEGHRLASGALASIGGGKPRATIIPLGSRPALGAYRHGPKPDEPLVLQTVAKTDEAVAAPIPLTGNREDDDRYSQLCSLLNLKYRRMWDEEQPSDDGRDMWRAYEPDGSRRWR